MVLPKTINDREHGKFGQQNDQIFVYVTDVNNPDIGFFIQDYDEISAGAYIGKSKISGEWRITLMTEVGKDLVFTYATINNNPTRTTYALAWANRLTLTYGDISTT